MDVLTLPASPGVVDEASLRAYGAALGASLRAPVIVALRGDLGALAAINFNRGDLMFASALLAFGLYSALMSRRPQVHQLSLISFCTGAGAALPACPLRPPP